MGIRSKPFVIWNLLCCCASLLRLLDGVAGAGLRRQQHRALLREGRILDEVFALLAQPVAESGGKWLPPELR